MCVCVCMQFLVVNKIYICSPTLPSKINYYLPYNKYSSHCRFHNNQFNSSGMLHCCDWWLQWRFVVSTVALLRTASFEMWRCVAGLVFPDVWKECSPFISIGWGIQDTNPETRVTSWKTWTLHNYKFLSNRVEGMWWHSWLRHCVTSPKVMG